MPLDDHPLNVVPNNVDRPLDSLNRFLDRNLDPILRSVERNLRPIGRIVQNSLPHVNRALRPVGRLLDRILLLSWILMDPIVEFILARPRNLVLYISLVMVLLSIFR